MMSMTEELTFEKALEVQQEAGKLLRRLDKKILDKELTVPVESRFTDARTSFQDYLDYILSEKPRRGSRRLRSRRMLL